MVPGHLTPGRLTRGAPAAELPGRECLVAGRFSGSWAARSRMSDGGELHEWAWVGVGCARPFGHVLRLCGTVGQRSPRVVRCSPCETVRSTLPCGIVCHRLPRTVARSCRAELSKHSSCRPFVQPCCVGSFISVVARGIPPARQGTGQHFTRGTCCAGYLQCWAVSARPDRPLSACRAGSSAQGSLNAPDWPAGQRADRAWPTRRRGIRMPRWCWPAGRSPCCPPRRWPPGNESPCPILRQR